MCINTGGEKVYPEEVEEVGQDGRRRRSTPWWSGSPTSASARRSWPSCELDPGAAADSVRAEAVIDHVKGRLAGYKAPRRVRFVETIGRSPAGKVDYARHRGETAEWLGVPLG